MKFSNKNSSVLILIVFFLTGLFTTVFSGVEWNGSTDSTPTTVLAVQTGLEEASSDISLEVRVNDIKWSSYHDFMRRYLSVTYLIRNLGDEPALDCYMVTNHASNGVEPIISLPKNYGTLDGRNSLVDTNVFIVPTGVTSFRNSIKISYKDKLGHTHNYPSDPTPYSPSVSNIVPTGTINTNATNITAAYSDSGSSIDTSSVVVKLDGSQLSGCTAGGAGVSCPVSGHWPGLPLGLGLGRDGAGNTGTGSASFKVDTLAPAVSNIVPTGTITTNATNITAAYSDSGSSIDASSVVVKLDGSPLSGCTAGGAGVSCPASGLARAPTRSRSRSATEPAIPARDRHPLRWTR